MKTANPTFGRSTVFFMGADILLEKKGKWLVKLFGWGYTHDRRADKNPYPHDRRADKDSYPHDRNVTDDLCSLIKLCFALIMINFST